jgi:hypothetical protein
MVGRKQSNFNQLPSWSRGCKTSSNLIDDIENSILDKHNFNEGELKVCPGKRENSEMFVQDHCHHGIFYQ